MQYPKIATDWKNEDWPPKTLKLNVTMIAPKNTEKMTAKKWSESNNSKKSTVNKESKEQAQEKWTPQIPIFKFICSIFSSTRDQHITEFDTNIFYFINEGITNSLIKSIFWHII